MRLATKLVTAFMVVALIVIGLDTAVAVRAELAGFEDQTRQDMKQVGLSLRGLLADASRAGRHAQAMEEIASRMPDGYHMHLRWVWIEGGPGEPRESGVTSAELQRAAEGIVYRDGTGSEWSMLAYVQVPTGDERVGAIEIEERPVRREQILAVLTTRAWRVSALLLLLAGVASVIVGSRMVARPLKQLIDTTRRIGAGDLSGRVELRGGDELAELGRSINDMCDRIESGHQALERETAERIEAVLQLRHADRLRTVGRLASGIAHELGTPLTVVSGRAEMIGSGQLKESEIVESARTIKSQADRMAQLVRELLDFGRRSTPDMRRSDLGPILQQSIDLVETLARKRGVELRLEGARTPCTVVVDTAQIQQVVTNLLVNAIQASPDRGVITVRLSETTGADDGPAARVDVIDRGAGIPEAQLEQVFEPFFTTKDVGEGTGMGLAIAEGITREHGGTITVTSTEGEGSCFTITLPMEATP